MALTLSGFRSLPKGKSGGKGGGKSGSGMPGFSKSQAVTAIKNSILKTTATGEIANINDADRLINALKTLGDSAEAQNAISETEALKQSLLSHQQDVSYNTAAYDADIEDSKAEAIVGPDGSFNSVKQIADNYHSIYEQAAQDYQNNVIAKSFLNAGEKGGPTEDMIKYQKMLEQKASFYKNVSLAASKTGPNGKAGDFSKAAFAAVPRLNPATGAIMGIDFVTQDEVRKDPNLMLTDAGLQSMDNGNKVPLALPTVDVPDPEDPSKIIKTASFGNMTFQQRKTQKADGSEGTALGNILRLVGGDQDEGWFGEKKDAVDANKRHKDLIDNGIALKANDGFQFDADSLPTGTVSSRMNRVFFTDNNGKVVESDGNSLQDRLENMKSYLKNFGLDPGKLIPPGYMSVAPKGVLDKVDPQKVNGDSLSPTPPSNPSATPAPAGPSTSPKGWASTFQSLGNVAGAVTSSFFANRKPSEGPSVPNKPNVAAESTGGKKNAPDIIAKGASFFNSRVA